MRLGIPPLHDPLKCNRRRDTRMGDKLAPRYTGPFVIHEFVSPGVYRLKDGDKVMKPIVNAKNLKLYMAPGSPESRSSVPRTPRKSSASSAASPQAPPTSKAKKGNKPSSPPKANMDDKPDAGPSSKASPPPKSSKGNKPHLGLTKQASTPPKAKKGKKSCAGQSIPPSPPPTTKPQQASSQCPVEWMKELNLNEDDRAILLSADGWLNDKIVDAVNKLIAAEIGGDAEQSTLLAQGAGRFRAKAFEGLQILHDVNHWVVAGCVGGEVVVADSLRRPVSGYLAKQLRELYPHAISRRTQQLKVTLVSCPLQTNASDCGVYAAASAFEWVKGNGPHGIAWDVAAMRRHLEQCLTMKQVLLFPKVPIKKRGRKEAKVVVMV